MYYSLIGANVIMALAIILNLNHLPPQIPLFYSKPSGEDQLADIWMIILLPLILNGIILLNNFFIKRFFSKDEFVKKIFYYLNFSIIIAVTFIFIKIIFLVT